MSKTLKELDKKYKESMKRKNKIPTGLEALDNIRDYGEWLPSLEMGIIRRELKALEIIKEKKVNVDIFLDRITRDTDYKEYKRLVGLYKITIFSNKDLTKEEFELLKEELL